MVNFVMFCVLNQLCGLQESRHRHDRAAVVSKDTDEVVHVCTHHSFQSTTGHLMADHLEFMDDMIEKTLKMEESMENLKGTYQKKKDAYNNIGFTTSADLDNLFETAKIQKGELSEQIASLKAAIEAQKARTSSFAVDAPDGTSDAMRAENLKQVDDIIDYAAEHEDKKSVEFKHKMKIRGVDAPDGTSDAMRAENLKQVDDIIDYAAEHEDKDKIEYEHKMDDAVRKERARDPEHDW